MFAKPKTIARWENHHYGQLLNNLEFVHRKGYTHRDLRAPNILIRSDGRAVISDYGFACKANTALPYAGTRNTASQRILSLFFDRSDIANIELEVTKEDDLESLCKTLIIYKYNLEPPICTSLSKKSQVHALWSFWNCDPFVQAFLANQDCSSKLAFLLCAFSFSARLK